MKLPVMKQRECGSCRECCTVLAIARDEDVEGQGLKEGAEWWKPQGQRCQYAKPGVGCAIHSDPARPTSCKTFHCLWLLGAGTEEERPDRTGVVLTSSTEGDMVVAHVNRRRRRGWEGGGVRKTLTGFAKASPKGMFAVVVDGETWLVRADGVRSLPWTIDDRDTSWSGPVWEDQVMLPSVKRPKR